ncbi:MAG: hypothetical protein WCO57_11095, partial [Verrucomicrobiota bacterium]
MSKFFQVAAKWISRSAPGSSRALIGRLAVLTWLPLVGCTAVPAYQQQQLAKPNMVFDDTQAFAFSARLLPQCE